MKKLLLIIPFLLMACDSSFVGRSYLTLKTSFIVYDRILTEASVDYKNGKITNKEKDEIVLIANDFYKTFNVTSENLYFYSEKHGKNATSILEKKEIIDQIISTTVKLNNLIDKYNNLIKDKKFKHVNCEIIYEDWGVNWIDSDSF